MAYFRKEITRYRIQIYGKSSSGPADTKAWLYLYGLEGVIGTIGFYLPDVVATKQDVVDSLGRANGNMAITEISAVMDILRNEKPVYVVWSETWKQVILETASEPVGEEEGAPLWPF